MGQPCGVRSRAVFGEDARAPAGVIIRGGEFRHALSAPVINPIEEMRQEVVHVGGTWGQVSECASPVLPRIRNHEYDLAL